MATLLACTPLRAYLSCNCMRMPADWPAQFYPRQVIHAPMADLIAVTADVMTERYGAPSLIPRQPGQAKRVATGVVYHAPPPNSACHTLTHEQPIGGHDCVKMNNYTCVGWMFPTREA